MPIYPHTIEEHKEGEGLARGQYLAGYSCNECGFCQCDELEGIHSTGCSSYDHSGVGDGYLSDA